MSTLADSIGTMLYNLELQANAVLLQISDAKNATLTALGPASLKKPNINDTPEFELKEPNSVYDALSTLKEELDKVRDEIPEFKELISKDKANLERQFEEMNRDRRLEMFNKYLALPVPVIKAKDDSGTDYDITEFKVPGDGSLKKWRVANYSDTRLSLYKDFASAPEPALPLPAFASRAWKIQAAARIKLENDLAVKAVKQEEEMIIEKAAQFINGLELEKQAIVIEHCLSYMNACMQPILKIYDAKYPTPEKMERLFSDLSEARATLISSIGNNTVADIKARLAYTGAVKEYYDLFEKVERLRLNVESLDLKLKSDDYGLRARQVAASASAAASAAAAGYSAIRIGYTLSEKAFT